ncbi:MAG: M23 family metallopeptidase [Holosporaceae bacterium]|jgi:murein DD-endopeptidase MepM/ murein hydrolase activator NlpD|nr:M23 family metallopeptidase [Holosporaceae bacterium]
MRRTLYLSVFILLMGCSERDQFSPVDIKIDEDMGDVARGAVHRVSGGETLFDVANIYDIDPINLAKINGIKYPYNVRDGQVLRLPTENSPSDREDEFPPKDVKKKDELDDEFASAMRTKGKSPPATAAAASEENILSTPKITRSAVGSSQDGAAATSAAKSRHPVAATGKMTRPINGKVISGFGDVKDGISNDGINIKAPLGTPVKASAPGEVIYTGNKLEEFGNTVILKHDNGLITSYAHLDSIKVRNGASIARGDVVGAVGKTGDVSEPQLHFEVLKNKTPDDPSKYF